jgi:hypothetical protein
MKNPGRDVKHMRLSPLGLQTFQSTYGFMVSALLNQAGTSAITQPESVQSMMGKTPQALRLTAAKESARDEWDRIMMEEMIKDVYRKWIQMIVQKQSKKLSVRLFGDEAKELAEDYPDIADFYPKSGYGVAKIGKQHLATKYDYVLESGATLKQDADTEKGNIAELLMTVMKAPQILQIMAQSGKQVDVGELFKRMVISSGIKDYEKIVKDVSPGGMPMQEQNLPMQDANDPEITKTMKAVQGLFQPGKVPPMNNDRRNTT